jgi:16S rRNA (cytosine1402-N4)-methyltransferase
MEQETPLSPIKKRRVRYKGTHPRHFAEKYKELQGECYSADVNKVLGGGGRGGRWRRIALRCSA